ncbi:MAG: sensor histidine kinase [Clostridia bacterium]|nr:sensor histidine kinase [Clostridia bacterium]
MLNRVKNKQGKNDYKIFATKKKIIAYFFIIVVIVFFIFNSVFYRLYSSNIRQIVIKESKSSVIKTREYVDMILESMEYTADVAQNNSLIQRRLDSELEENPEYYTMNKEIVEALQGIVTNTVSRVASIDLFIKKEGKLITSDYGMFSSLEESSRDYFTQLQQSSARFAFTDNYRKKLNFMSNRNYEQVTLVRPLYILSKGSKAGVVAINLDKYELKTIIQGNPDSSSMILDSEGNRIIGVFSEKHQNSVAQIEGFKTLMNKDSGELLCNINGEEYVLVYETSEYSGWKFVSVVPANTSTQQMSELRDYILMLFLLMNTITALILIILLSEKVYRKLKKLILSMKEVEKGNFNINIQHNEKDEFGYMYASFNSMVNRIKTLFGELYEQKLLQKDAELKLLQSKINPHFIYNIFDNMNWLIQLERYSELEVLVDSVSGYFKKSLNAGKDFITVADTMEQLKNYVQIQRIRFRNRFECTFDFDDEIMDMLIPNFMLQPLVENAICHGIEPKPEESLIQVKGIKIEDRVFFTIEDNGVGINPDTLENIAHFLEGGKTEADNYYALANINKRIKLHYGEEYGLTVRSTQGAGTKVTIIIPANAVNVPEEILC